MNFTAEMVHFILKNATKFPWSIQGLGMLRLYLSSAVRLHVWGVEAKRPGVTTLHDHPWDFESLIISGRLTNVIYDLSKRALGDTRPFVPNYMKQQIVCGPGGGMDAEPKPVELALDWVHTYGPGDRYSQTGDEIHESLPVDGTVTIIRRYMHPDTEHAHVFYPIKEQWVSAEPRNANEDEIRRITERALKMWRPVKVLTT